MSKNPNGQAGSRQWPIDLQLTMPDPIVKAECGRQKNSNMTTCCVTFPGET